jgi:hypothetical protein
MDIAVFYKIKEGSKEKGFVRIFAGYRVEASNIYRPSEKCKFYSKALNNCFGSVVYF